MKFCIQTSNPKWEINKYDANNTCLSEAIEDAFILNTENAFICWNHIYISLSYKYDISYMIDDVLKMISKIQENNHGELTICWLPDTFRCDWKIEWKNGEIYIISHWESIVGDLEELLNKNNTIQLPTIQFTNEWKKLLEIIIDVLQHNGYSENNLKGMKELIRVYNKIDDVGVIYKHD